MRACELDAGADCQFTCLLALGGGMIGILLGHGILGVASPYVIERSGISLGVFEFNWQELVLIPGLVILASSLALWHFWVSTALQTLVGASLAVGSALVTDLVPEEALGAGLALEEALHLAARCGAACLMGRGPYEGQLTAS